jgi:hypothetical protein
MNPNSLCKNETESGHQMALIVYLQVAEKYGFFAADRLPEKIACPSKPVPELKWLHAIPNGGARGDDARSSAIRGNKMKMEGVKEGVADLCWPFRNKLYSGLYIEMKRPAAKAISKIAKGGLSTEQIEFRDFVIEQGFKWVVCYSWQEAVKIIKQYYGYSE